MNSRVYEYFRRSQSRFGLDVGCKTEFQKRQTRSRADGLAMSNYRYLGLGHRISEKRGISKINKLKILIRSRKQLMFFARIAFYFSSSTRTMLLLYRSYPTPRPNRVRDYRVKERLLSKKKIIFNNNTRLIIQESELLSGFSCH